MDVAASLAQGKTIRVATVHLAAARKKNLESKVASKGPMLHPATTAHLSTEKALQEFDSLFSDTRKLLLTQFMPMVTSSTPPRHRLPFTGGAQTANATRSKDRGISERTAKVLTGCIGAINIGRGCVHCMTIRLRLFRLYYTSPPPPPAHLCFSCFWCSPNNHNLQASAQQVFESCNVKVCSRRRMKHPPRTCSLMGQSWTGSGNVTGTPPSQLRSLSRLHMRLSSAIYF